MFKLVISCFHALRIPLYHYIILGKSIHCACLILYPTLSYYFRQLPDSLTIIMDFLYTNALPAKTPPPDVLRDVLRTMILLFPSPLDVIDDQQQLLTLHSRELAFTAPLHLRATALSSTSASSSSAAAAAASTTPAATLSSSTPSSATTSAAAPTAAPITDAAAILKLYCQMSLPPVLVGSFDSALAEKSSAGCSVM